MGEKGTTGYEAMKKGLLPTTTRETQPTATGMKQIEVPSGWHVDSSDPDRAFNERTGQNAVWDDTKQQWTDTKTGQPVGAAGVTPIK